VALCAFDLLELDGEDLRRMPIETRKLTLKSLLRGKHAGTVFNEHFTAEGAIVYRQACALGCERIVSKQLGSPYRSGRADCWVKVKNPTRAWSATLGGGAAICRQSGKKRKCATCA
jgi:bifunctional non-homologous end joining protein LigD